MIRTIFKTLFAIGAGATCLIALINGLSNPSRLFEAAGIISGCLISYWLIFRVFFPKR